MNLNNDRTPQRSLIVGCTAFAAIDTIPWETKVVPNIPDYDIVFVSVPHITTEFLKGVDRKYFEKMKKALILFLHTGGRMIVLTSPRYTVKRPKKYPEQVSNLDWCPIHYVTREESGKSIINRAQFYPSYLQKMTAWSFYITIPQQCLTDEINNFPAQLKATHHTISVNCDFTLWPWRITDNYAEVVLTLRAGAVEVFGHFIIYRLAGPCPWAVWESFQNPSPSRKVKSYIFYTIALTSMKT